MSQMFAQTILQHGIQKSNQIALRQGDVRLTWHELLTAARQQQEELRRHAADHYLLLQCDPSIAFAVRLCAAMLSGKPLVLLPPVLPADVLHSVATRLEYARPSSDGFEVVLLTSGTTAQPKLVRLREDELFMHALAAATHLGLNEDDTWLACLPVHHVGGLAIFTRAFAVGHSIVIAPARKPMRLYEALLGEGITHTSLVPTQLKRLMEAAEHRALPPHVRCLLVGGAALPERLANLARTLGYPVAPTYGLTEACSQVATLPPARFLAGENALRPLPCVEIRIDNQTQEIHLRGASLFSGYLGEQPRDQTRWFATGDMGRFEGGRLTILDRRTDLIVSGGENVSPARVEQVLLRHPAVADACVVGVPDEEWGLRVVAVIEPVLSTACEAEDIRRFCRLHLARHEIPKTVLVTKELPRTLSGKIARAGVRAWVLARLDGVES